MIRFDFSTISSVFNHQIRLVVFSLSTAFRLMFWACIASLMIFAWQDWTGLQGVFRLLAHSDQFMVRRLLSMVGLLILIASLCLYAFHLVQFAHTRTGRANHRLPPPYMRRSDQVSIP